MEKKSLMDILGGDKKKIRTDIVTFVLVGVALIFWGGAFGKDNKAEEVKPVASVKEEREDSLEGRLETILSKTEGAGKVDVLITYKTGKEMIVAQQMSEEDTSTKENAVKGDERDIKSSIKENSYVIMENSDGSQTPLVLKEVEPEIEGVIIVAEGGDNILVKNNLIAAAEAALGVSTHKVQVLKMKV